MTNINPYDAFGACYTNSQSQSAFRNLEAKNSFTAGDYTPFLKKSLGEVPPCVYAKPVLSYLNNATVRT
jgi:hypothetical protein